MQGAVGGRGKGGEGRDLHGRNCMPTGNYIGNYSGQLLFPLFHSVTTPSAPPLPPTLDSIGGIVKFTVWMGRWWGGGGK